MTDDTPCAQSHAEMLRRFVGDMKTADRVVIQRRNALGEMDASYYPNPALMAALIEEQATEIERLGRELNKAKYRDPDFAWETHQAAMDAAQAEIERLRQAIWQALDDMGDGYCVCPAAKEQMRGVLASIEQEEALTKIAKLGQEYDR